MGFLYILVIIKVYLKETWPKIPEIREVRASLESLTSTNKGSGQRMEETPERGKIVHQPEGFGYKLMDYINISKRGCISDHGELVSQGGSS